MRSAAANLSRAQASLWKVRENAGTATTKARVTAPTRPRRRLRSRVFNFFCPSRDRTSTWDTYSITDAAVSIGVAEVQHTPLIPFYANRLPRGHSDNPGTRVAPVIQIGDAANVVAGFGEPRNPRAACHRS